MLGNWLRQLPESLACDAWDFAEEALKGRGGSLHSVHPVPVEGRIPHEPLKNIFKNPQYHLIFIYIYCFIHIYTLYIILVYISWLIGFPTIGYHHTQYFGTVDFETWSQSTGLFSMAHMDTSRNASKMAIFILPWRWGRWWAWGQTSGFAGTCWATSTVETNWFSTSLVEPSCNFSFNILELFWIILRTTWNSPEISPRDMPPEMPDAKGGKAPTWRFKGRNWGMAGMFFFIFFHRLGYKKPLCRLGLGRHHLDSGLKWLLETRHIKSRCLCKIWKTLTYSNSKRSYICEL